MSRALDCAERIEARMDKLPDLIGFPLWVYFMLTGFALALGVVVGQVALVLWVVSVL